MAFTPPQMKGEGVCLHWHSTNTQRHERAPDIILIEALHQIRSHILVKSLLTSEGALCAMAQVIEQINLPSQNRTGAYNYSSFLPDPTVCTGTHSVGYSNVSQQ